MNIAEIEGDKIRNSHKRKLDLDNRLLRLHTIGDCSKASHARELAQAVDDTWYPRNGGTVWSYTHSAKRFKRKNWGSIQVLGSVDSVADFDKVRQNGYAVAHIVPEFQNNKSFVLNGVRLIPCPHQLGLRPKKKHAIDTTYASIEKSCPTTCKLKKTKECYGLNGRTAMVNRRLIDTGAIFVEGTNNEKLQTCAECKLCLNSDRLFDQNMGIAFAAHGTRKNSLRRRLTVLG